MDGALNRRLGPRVVITYLNSEPLVCHYISIPLISEGRISRPFLAWNVFTIARTPVDRQNAYIRPFALSK